MADFEQASDRVIGGSRTTSSSRSRRRRSSPASSSRHAVAGWFLEHADRRHDHRAARQRRGQAQYLPKGSAQGADHGHRVQAPLAARGGHCNATTPGRPAGRDRDGLPDDPGLRHERPHRQLAFPPPQEGGFPSKLHSDVIAADDGRGGQEDRRRPCRHARVAAPKHEATSNALLLERETINHTDIVEIIGKPVRRRQVAREFVTPTPPPRRREVDDRRRHDGGYATLALMRSNLRTCAVRVRASCLACALRTLLAVALPAFRLPASI